MDMRIEVQSSEDKILKHTFQRQLNTVWTKILDKILNIYSIHNMHKTTENIMMHLKE